MTTASDDLLKRITARPDVFNGKPIIRDMRISVEFILSLLSQGHDALDARDLGPDPGDRALLERAVSENRILITMDKDFGELIHLHERPHTGLLRLPEVRMAQRITLVENLILNHRQALDERAIITVTSGRIRISRQPLR